MFVLVLCSFNAPFLFQSVLIPKSSSFSYFNSGF